MLFRTVPSRTAPKGLLIAFLALASAAALAAGGLSHEASQSVQLALTEARVALKKGKPTPLVAALERALATARAEAPLEVRRVEVVGRPHTGLGIYDPLPDARVPGRHLQLYVEVANFSHAERGEGRSEVALEVNGAFFFEDGTALGEKSLGTHRFTSRTATGVTSFGLDVRLGEKSPAGTYRIDLKVKDLLSGKEGSSTVTFRLP